MCPLDCLVTLKVLPIGIEDHALTSSTAGYMDMVSMSISNLLVLILKEGNEKVFTKQIYSNMLVSIMQRSKFNAFNMGKSYL